MNRSRLPNTGVQRMSLRAIADARLLGAWRFIVVVLACALSSSVVGQSLDQLSASVVFLFDDKTDTVMISGKPFEVGLRAPGTEKFVPKTSRTYASGFFVGSQGKLFLVTAKHVAGFLTPDSHAAIRTDLGSPSIVSMRDLTGWQSEIRWTRHATRDVAVVALKPSADVMRDLGGHFLSVDSLATETPSRDIVLTVLGFPLEFGSAGPFSPISRETRLAGGPIESQVGSVLLLQDPSVGGYSGAPVFDLGLPVLNSGGISMRGSALRVVGVVSGTFSDETGGKLGSIVQASSVLDLINDAEQRP